MTIYRLPKIQLIRLAALFNLVEYHVNIIPRVGFPTFLHCSLGSLHNTCTSCKVVERASKYPLGNMELHQRCRCFALHVVTTFDGAPQFPLIRKRLAL